MNGIKKQVGKRATTWTAIVEGGNDPVTGKRKQIKKTFRTQKEARDWRTKTLHELRVGVYIEDSIATLQEYLMEWLKAVEPNVRVSTADRYRRIVMNNLVPDLGAIPLGKLTPIHVQQFHSRCQASGLSNSTIALYHGVLHKALEQAVKWQMLGRNVCHAVESPKRVSPEMKTWDLSQVRWFLDATSFDTLAALWRLAVSTGMRRGELLALRWGDVDVDRGELSVRRTITRGQNGLTTGEPKTAKGKRSISLPASCVTALKKHRISQTRVRLNLGPVWQDNDLVFERGNGDVLHPNIVSSRFRKLCEQTELPKIRFHDLRHTAATLMLANGEHPKIVQERLGHSDISMTLNLYSHVLPSMQRDAADRIEAMLGS